MAAFHEHQAVNAKSLSSSNPAHFLQFKASGLSQLPFGGQIWFEPAAAQIHVNQHLVRNFEHTGTLGVYGAGE